MSYLLATTPNFFRWDIGGLSSGCAEGTDRHLLPRLTVRERRPERRRGTTETALLLTSDLSQFVVGLSVNGDWHLAYPHRVLRPSSSVLNQLLVESMRPAIKSR